MKLWTRLTEKLLVVLSFAPGQKQTERRQRVSFINEYDHAEYEEGFIECIKTDRSHYKVLKKAKRIFEYAN